MKHCTTKRCTSLSLEGCGVKSAALFPSGQQLLFSDDDISVAFDVTELVAVEVHQQLPEPKVGGREVNPGLSVLAGTHGAAQPGE